MKNKCLECDLTASYNISGQKARYCSKHKKENMINVKHSRCKDENCNSTSPSFNYITEKKGIYCSTHKKENMINVYKICQSKNCTIYPSYNYQGKTKGIYCNEHKKENMINVVDKKCLEKNCNTIPYFNLPDKKSGLYCVKHKKENMIDVGSKKCKEENCKEKAAYNLPNSIGNIYCYQHKKNGMTDDLRHKKCLIENCNITPSYNLPNNNKPLYCKEHSTEIMIDVKNKKCLGCNDTIANRKYKGYCCRCFINLFPHEKISRNYKIKENHMTDFLKKEFNDEVMIFDKQTGGCSKRRPDCYIDKFTHIVIVECDENQHKDTSCENKRTMELFQDFGNRPIVFIRFNPDKYINKNKKFSSSFKLCKKTGISIIKTQKEWQNRLNLLKETINKSLIKIPEREITYEYLFYDK
jgi:hypothetical protein